MKKRIFMWGILIPFIAGFLPAPAAASSQPPVYVSPAANAQWVSPSAVIVVRYATPVNPGSLSAELFEVSGSASGKHTGAVLLADDGMTINFTPTQPFTPGETVTVIVQPGLTAASGEALAGVTLRFTVDGKVAPKTLSQAERLMQEAAAIYQRFEPAKSLSSTAAKLLPEDFPAISVVTAADETADGYLFLALMDWSQSPDRKRSYLLILDDNAQPVWYQRLEVNNFALDFKKQPNGLLSYFDLRLGGYRVLNSAYQEVGKYFAKNYPTDLHEFLMLPNNHTAYIIYDTKIIDMSEIVEGGNPEAEVTGVVIQELDSKGNIVLEWRSWDWIPFEDMNDNAGSLTAAVIDLVHTNSIELDWDGNYIISSRHLNELTKIDRRTGEIVWRMGGKKNQFTYVNIPDNVPYAFQHDLRRLPNGNITVYDNRNNRTPEYSRAVEFALDEDNMTLTQVWEFRQTPADIYGRAMGSARRQLNGNTLIGWGFYSAMTEAKRDGSTALRFDFAPYYSYRAFRFPWVGNPLDKPQLRVENQGTTTTLTYAWNGATEVAAWKVYGGLSAASMMLLETHPKTAYETTTLISDNTAPCYLFFRVVPVNKKGQELTPSNIASGVPGCGATWLYLPAVEREP